MLPTNLDNDMNTHTPEMRLYTRHEHGSRLVRVYADDEGSAKYEVSWPSGTVVYRSVRSLMGAIHGGKSSITFDRYFRVGKFRQRGRHSGSANLLSMFDSDPGRTRRTSIAVLGPRGGRATDIVFARSPCKGEEEGKDQGVAEFLEALDADLKQRVEVKPTLEMMQAFEQSFGTMLDRLEGKVGIDLGAKSGRSDARTKADEVRKLLWSGFAGKMLSQGYDPDDVLQEVYRGILVRDKGKCPWDARKSTFGHYVHMIVGCVTTNYHRKQVRRIDRNAVSLDVGADGEDRADVGQWGSVKIWSGSDAGDRMALEGLVRHLAGVKDGTPEAVLGRKSLPWIAAGMTRAEIATKVKEKPAMVSRALTWLRRQAAKWAEAGDLAAMVPSRHRAAVH